MLFGPDDEDRDACDSDEGADELVHEEHSKVFPSIKHAIIVCNDYKAARNRSSWNRAIATSHRTCCGKFSLAK
eukprot:224852-Karenia_brevis.AAC.1